MCLSLLVLGTYNISELWLALYLSGFPMCFVLVLRRMLWFICLRFSRWSCFFSAAQQGIRAKRRYSRDPTPYSTPPNNPESLGVAPPSPILPSSPPGPSGAGRGTMPESPQSKYMPHSKAKRSKAKQARQYIITPHPPNQDLGGGGKQGQAFFRSNYKAIIKQLQSVAKATPLHIHIYPSIHICHLPAPTPKRGRCQIYI